MSFDVLPKDVVWLILSDVINLIWMEHDYYEGNFYERFFGTQPNNPMANQVIMLTNVCKKWRLLVRSSYYSKYSCYFKFHPGTNRHATGADIPKNEDSRLITDVS
jgi:hypothetical protein